LRNDRGGCDLRSGNSDRGATAARVERRENAGARFEQKLSVVRRGILGLDMAALAVAGYWIGNVVAGVRG
jgi:hypothetical protein